MLPIVEAIIIYAAEEIIALLIFYIVRKIFRETPDPDQKPRPVVLTVLKGMLERLFIYVGLILDYPQCLTVFAALKIGTRLEDAKSKHISNDYFLVGNLISVLLALVACYIYSRSLLLSLL
jgi:hypothetical protein